MAPESGRGFAFAGDRRRRKPLREPSALRSAAAARSDRAREARWLTSHHQCWIADPCMKRLPNRGNYVFSDQTLETIGHILVFPGIPAGAVERNTSTNSASPGANYLCGGSGILNYEATYMGVYSGKEPAKL
uniref:Uncharacterized protein n=1 Tax=Oryza meridionalis TaxID=40149 RepID=A0A0E0C7H5_9ORYZ